MATSGLDQRFLKQPKPLDEMNLTRSWEDALDLAGGTVVHVSCDFDGCMSCVRTSTVRLGFFLGGPVRDTGIINTGAYDLARAATVAIPCEQVCRMLMDMLAIGIVSVVWIVLGISLAFRDGRDFIGDVDWAMLQGNQQQQQQQLQGNQQQQQQQLQGNRQQQQQQQGELGGGGDEDKEMCPQHYACGGRGHRAEESLVKQRWKGRQPLSSLDVNFSSAVPKSASSVKMSASDVLAASASLTPSGPDDVRHSHITWLDGVAVAGKASFATGSGNLDQRPVKGNSVPRCCFASVLKRARLEQALCTRAKEVHT
jgi:hypothetical protein